MSRSSRLGGWVAAQYPWVVQLYRAGLSYAEIAAKLPELNETAWGPRMAEAAVGYAVRMLTDDEELQRLARQHRRSALERTVGGFGTEAGREFSRRAGRRNIEKHGVDVDGLTRAKGFLPWSAEERAYVLERLLPDASFRHSNGSMKGLVAYARMAEAVNREFHRGRMIRTASSVKAMVERTRRLERAAG